MLCSAATHVIRRDDRHPVRVELFERVGGLGGSFYDLRALLAPVGGVPRVLAHSGLL